MKSFVQAFIQARAADGVTPKTLTWHRTSLNRFTIWAESEGKVDPESWTVIDIRAYIATLQADKRLSATSVATYVRSLRAFLKWLHDEELLPTNLVAKVKAPKSPILQKQPFTDSELRKLLSAAESSRDKAIIAVLLDCGLRADELCQLKVSDIVFENRTLTVMGKGRKVRTVPFSSRTATILRKALIKNDSEYALPSRTNQALTTNGLLYALVRIGKKAGVEHVHPHKFRHTMSVSYLRNGGDPLSLQRILGHTTLAMTNHYVSMATTDMSRVHDIASPMSRLMGGAK
jgi:integrase/recombinase XerD